MDWLKKLLAGRPGQSAAPSASGPTEAELVDDFRAMVRRNLATGFIAADEALDAAIELMADELDPAMLNQIGPAILAEELAAHIEREEHYPVVTDCDRLDAAFAALEEDGIVARQNYTCCGTCGAAEIWDEMNDIAATGQPVRGYVFYHWQDTDAAAEGSGLYLNYGSIDDGDAAAVAIGQDARAMLEKHGLKTSWSGRIDQRIGVSLEWQRRLPRPAAGSLH